jgi:hypothetical protein
MADRQPQLERLTGLIRKPLSVRGHRDGRGCRSLRAEGNLATVLHRELAGLGFDRPYQALVRELHKPRLSARLFGKTHRGAHPRLRAIFEAKPGEANTAHISFALPHSEFIDQAHFRTICSRMQFAARQCPAPQGDDRLGGRGRARRPGGPPCTAGRGRSALHGPPSLSGDHIGRLMSGGRRASFRTRPSSAAQSTA